MTAALGFRGSGWTPRSLRRIQTCLAGCWISDPWRGSISKFLQHVAVQRDDDRLTVKELVLHYAHREGGVHFDPTPPESKLLNDILEESEQAPCGLPSWPSAASFTADSIVSPPRSFSSLALILTDTDALRPTRAFRRHL